MKKRKIESGGTKYMKFKAADRMTLVNKKTMKKLVKYLKKEGCTNFNLSWAVNYLVNIAIGELETIDE